MTAEELTATLAAAGYYPDQLDIDDWSEEPVVRTTRTPNQCPIVQAFKDRRGRWILSAIGYEYCHVPNESAVPDAVSALLQAMGPDMKFSPEVIARFNLIELDPSEFPIGSDSDE